MNGDLEHVVLARLEHLEKREKKRDDAQLNLLGEVLQVKQLMHDLSEQFASEVTHLHSFFYEQFQKLADAKPQVKPKKKRKAR